MPGIDNAPHTHMTTTWQKQFSYNEILDRFEPLSSLSPEQRRELEIHPELNPNNKEYWESRAGEYDAGTLPPCCDLDPTTSAFLELLDNIPGRTIETGLGVSANDVRSGKFGALSHSALRELEKLDKNQNYQLVSRIKEENDSMSGSLAWFPENGGSPIEIESSTEGTVFPPNGSALLEHIDLSMLIPTYNNEGISANELRSGKYGRLPPEINQSLEKLQNHKDYALTTLFSPPPNEAPYMAWVEKKTDDTVLIHQDPSYAMY